MGLLRPLFVDTVASGLFSLTLRINIFHRRKEQQCKLIKILSLKEFITFLMFLRTVCYFISVILSYRWYANTVKLKVKSVFMIILTWI